MLSAFAEARSSTSDNWDLFPNDIRSWAQQNDDEIALIGIELSDDEPEPDDDEPVLCESDAIVGTGTGVCLTRLTPQGDCPRSGSHI